mmetsp:Transcript_9216/g.26805  ORF Transcript_9216/g.26805 Transcript_9216/m.26805 type:complete len:311 (+) Transcript_9216:133-1065(+)
MLVRNTIAPVALAVLAFSATPVAAFAAGPRAPGVRGAPLAARPAARMSDDGFFARALPDSPRGLSLGRSLFARRAERKKPWERFTESWGRKWEDVDPAHVAKEVAAAIALQMMGELFAQLLLGYDMSHIDWHRACIRSTAVGFWYAAWMSRYLHAIDAVDEIHDEMGSQAGKRGELLSAGVRASIDNFLSTPFLYFPFIHVFTGIALDHQTFGECLISYQKIWLQENESSCALYIPTQLANFAVVPPKYRAPVLFTVDFCWAIVWALLLTPKPEEAAAAVAAAGGAVDAAVAASGDGLAVAATVAGALAQ